MTQDSRFNFDQAYERLAKLQLVLEELSELTPEAADRVLKERAAAYARAPERAPLASEQLDVLMFQLAGERYAIESRFVVEVLRSPEITDVPGSPPVLDGVCNLRGEILAVMKLGVLLGTSPGGWERRQLVVLGVDRAELGIVVEDVHEMVPLRTDALLAPARTLREISRAWIRAVTADSIVVLDGQAVLDDPRLIIDVPET